MTAWTGEVVARVYDIFHSILKKIRPSFFYFLIYEKIFKMLESGGRIKIKIKTKK